MATIDNISIQVRVERDVSFPNGSTRTYADCITLPVSQFLTPAQTTNLINAAKSSIVPVAKSRIDSWKAAVIEAETNPLPPPSPQERWAYLSDADLAEIKALAIAKGL